MILRVDDRLLHGQVIYGWGIFGPINEIWLVNDAVEADPMEKEIYTSVLEGRLKGGVLSFEQMVSRFTPDCLDCEDQMLVVESCSDLKRIIDSGIIPEQIHLGAISRNGNRRSINSAVALDEDDSKILRDLRKSGFEVIIKDLPDNEEIHVKL